MPINVKNIKKITSGKPNSLSETEWQFVATKYEAPLQDLVGI